MANTSRAAGTSDKQIEQMNPSRTSPSMDEDSSRKDPDTCRICHGESSSDEPLFFPCKCSGSIKYVHQECLMTWLSHVQKKYCEVCKTQFRFTKLYDPHMPKTIPAPVFLRHVISQTFQTLLFWSRAMLVALVWLVLLPWAMRLFWRFLFWSSDCGWGGCTAPERLQNMVDTQTTNDAVAQSANQLQDLMARASDLSMAPGMASETFRAIIQPISQALNSTSAEPIALRLFKRYFYFWRAPEQSASYYTFSADAAIQYRSSVLSEVLWLKTLTRSPALNKVIIAILEGQMITFLVVIGFILIFLIREWVVQQQPALMMGNALEDEGRPAPEPVPREPAAQDVAPLRPAQPQNQPADLGPVGGLGIDLPQIDLGAPLQEEIRPFARPRRRVPLPPNADTGESANNRNTIVPERGLFGASPPQGEVFHFRSRSNEENETELNSISHDLKVEDFSETKENQLKREGHNGSDWPGIRVFKDFWARGQERPSEVIRLIESEGRTEELKWIIDRMKRLENQENSQGMMNRTDSLLRKEPSSILFNSIDDGHSLSKLNEQDRAITLPSLTPKSDTAEPKGKGRAIEEPPSQTWSEVAENNQSGYEVIYEPNSRIFSMDEDADYGVGKPQDVLGALTTRTLQGLNAADSENILEPSFPSSNSVIANDEPSEVTPSDLNLISSSERVRVFDLPSSSKSHTLRSIIAEEAPRIETLFGVHSRDIYIHERREYIDYLKAVLSEEDFSVEAFEESLKTWLAGDGPATSITADRLRLYMIEAHSRKVDSEDETSTTCSEFESVKTPLSGETSAGTGEDVGEGDSGTALRMDVPLPVDGTINGNDTRAPPNGPQPPINPNPTWSERLVDWFWGDIAPRQPRNEPIANDEHVVNNLADEEPFVPIEQNRQEEQAQIPEEAAPRDPEVVEAAIAAGLDPNDADQIEDPEDLEGLMELVGMRGPITSLFQNGLFSAVLVGCTVAIAIWLPYGLGKFVLVLLANPISILLRIPLQLLFWVADFAVDLILLVMGAMILWVDFAVRLLSSLLGKRFVFLDNITASSKMTSVSTSLLQGSFGRLSSAVLSTVQSRNVSVSLNDVEWCSAMSHEILVSFKNTTSLLAGAVYNIGNLTNHIQTLENLSTFSNHSFSSVTIPSAKILTQRVGAASSSMLSSHTVKNFMTIPEASDSVDLELARWGSWDRFLAIMIGYAFLSFLGAIYLHRNAPFSTSETGRKIEKYISEFLQQAGGVLKVILIISIEMIVFPLYCGLLLDVALLPLFLSATVGSRFSFTFNSPWTSLFVHWFVGTCYMFHFALFVSMCRRIMRTGVLYFIRDPDDPTFHPVRDVLERNVSTQLRKILFSAIVYGALVIICLGSVVWGLNYAFRSVLPIHWSSNEPVLEFPVDLLFYNFLMPQAVKFFKPSDALNTTYTWWFRRCARVLRLTQFLFGERKEDEEGYQIWKRGDRGTDSGDGNTKRHLEFIRDGRYVRAPASDQVRIPKGGRVFLEVSEENKRLDGQPDWPEGLHGHSTHMFKKVYVPPMFRIRIGLFIILIWVFAAITGLGVTIIPLLFGRIIFRLVIPSHLRMNDVYAFSLGVYLLGGLIYGILYFQTGVNKLREYLESNNLRAIRTTFTLLLRATKLFYTYAAFIILIPSLLALLMDFYFMMPLHTYMAPKEAHTVYFVQDWTLGVLYTQLGLKFILWHTNSRPAQALRAVVRDGWLNPNARIATRCFILPTTIFMLFALLGPIGVARLANRTIFASSSESFRKYIYRYSYPAALVLCFGALLGYALSLAYKRWRQNIKDDVYLIGERLHNFNEATKQNLRPASSGSGGPVAVV